MYVKVENNVAVVYPYSLTSLPTDYPQTSFPADIENIDLAEYGVYPVVPQDIPPYNPATQIVEQGMPQNVDGEWMQKWIVVDLTPEEIAQREEMQRQTNKATAESLLQATDWTATVDINDPQYSNPYLDNQPEFLAYRSDVRKIAVNPPVTVDAWPTIPEEVWVTVPAE